MGLKTELVLKKKKKSSRGLMRRLRSSSSSSSKPAAAGEGASTSANTPTKRRRKHKRETLEVDVIKQMEQQQQEKKKRGLPDELWRKILESVDDNSVMAFASVCKQLRRVQQEAGRRLRTDLRPYYYLIEDGKGKGPPVDKLSTGSEDWCLWNMSSLTAEKEEKKRKHLVKAAAYWGHLNLLKQWREQSSELRGFLGKDTCAHAAKGGHLDVLKYLHENGCPWDEWTCAGAAVGGHLELLKYLHENVVLGLVALVFMQLKEVTWKC